MVNQQGQEEQEGYMQKALDVASRFGGRVAVMRITSLAAAAALVDETVCVCVSVCVCVLVVVCV